MKKRIFLVALSVLTLAACTNDEVIEENKNEIKFAVTTDMTTRAGAVATTTQTIDNFKVYGYTIATNTGTSYGQSKTYLEEEVTKDENGKWKFDDTHFWPDENLDFYAFSPIDFIRYGAPLTNGGANYLNEGTSKYVYIVPDGKTDFLYAVNVGESRDNPTVKLNFRHAFAQLIFKAKNTNKNLGIEISKVSVVNMLMARRLSLPQKDTYDSGNEVGAFGTIGTDRTGTYTGSLDATLNAASIQVSTEGNESCWLTKNANGESVEGLFVAPQTVLYWDPTVEHTSTTTTAVAYFVISCKVWNIPNENNPNNNITYLWGSANEYKDIAVPVVVKKTTTDENGTTTTTDTYEWEQGTKYIYTFNFTEGAGYVPPTDGEVSDPVLVPIKVEVTVDEFKEGNPQQEVDMETE